MKKITLTVFAALVAFMSFSQPKNPVSWNYEAKKVSADTYELSLTATVESPWHIYSQNTGKGGPIATEIKIKPNPLVTIQNKKFKEIGKIEKAIDKNFGTTPVEVVYFGDKVQFVQTVKVKGNAKTSISGTVEYMVCDDSQCLPPVKKSFDLKLQ